MVCARRLVTDVSVPELDTADEMLVSSLISPLTTAVSTTAFSVTNLSAVVWLVS